MKLTARQQIILEFIEKWTQENGFPPTVREIGEGVGLKSTSTVHGYLNRLESMGYIKRDPTKPRTLKILVPKPEELCINEAPIPQE